MYINCTYWFPSTVKAFGHFESLHAWIALFMYNEKVTMLIGSTKFQRPREIVFINLFPSHLLNFYWKFSVLQASMNFFFNNERSQHIEYCGIKCTQFSIQGYWIFLSSPSLTLWTSRFPTSSTAARITSSV